MTAPGYAKYTSWAAERPSVAPFAVQVRIDATEPLQTRPAVLESYLNYLRNAKSPEDALTRARALYLLLQATHAFEVIDLFLERSTISVSSGQEWLVRLREYEKKRLVGVYVSDHELGYNERGVLTLRGEWRSPRLSLDHIFCMIQFNRASGPIGLELGYVAPLYEWSKRFGQLLVGTVNVNISRASLLSSIECMIREAGVSVRIGMKHTVSYLLSWRQNLPTISAPWLIRQEAGHSFSSSISHSWVHDTTLGRLAEAGMRLVSTQTFSGLGGDVKFLKWTGSAHWTLPLHEYLSFSSRLRMGYLQPLFGDVSRINDRFDLNVRGFEALGPRTAARGELLRSEMYAVLSLHLFAPLIRDWGLSLQAFWNGGNALRYDTTQTRSQNADRFTSTLNSAVGVGLVWQPAAGSGYVECNYTVPLKFNSSLATPRRWQFGMMFSW